jgi:predicted AAA+ superfamily ATPase
MNNTINTVIGAWVDKKIPNIISRDTNIESYLDMKPKKIVVITGFRRIGKTYLLYQLLNGLLKNKNKEQVVYINFDDERIPERTEFLTELLPGIRRIFSSELEYLFLDEIQNMPNWSKWLRRIYDNEDLTIFITGSSSKVSSRELPTELRGRCLEVKLFPLSFSEFLRFKNIDIDLKTAQYSEKERIKILKMLDEFLNYGGMPEVVLSTEEKKFEILQQYYGTVVRRDIVERFGIKNEEGLKAMLRLLLNYTQYTISKLYDTLKSLNYEIGKTTILNYLSYIESSYFIHSLPIFSPKVKDQLQYPRKLYFIDNGFITSLSTRFSENIGRLFENTVAIELFRKYSKTDVEFYYWRDKKGKEVDFVIKDGLKIKQLVQVCYDIGHYDTKKREIDALSKASSELKCNDLLVIDDDYEGVEIVKDKRIKYIPLWKWLLKK